MPGRMLTQAACRRATISRAIRYACSSVPTVVTTTIACMTATLLHSFRVSQSRDNPASIVPLLGLGVVGEDRHLARAVVQPHGHQVPAAVAQIDRARGRGAERAERGEVGIVEANRVVQTVHRLAGARVPGRRPRREAEAYVAAQELEALGRHHQAILAADDVLVENAVAIAVPIEGEGDDAVFLGVEL